MLAFNSNTLKTIQLKIKTGATFQSVIDSLTANKVLNNLDHFKTVSSYLKYDHLVKPGIYKINSGMSNWALVRLLRSGNQSEITVRFESKRTLDDLAQALSNQLEFSPQEFLQLAKNDTFIANLGFNQKNIPNLFIPNSYQCFYTISVENFFKLMKKHHSQFWNESRLKKAKDKNLDPEKVGILASIVEAETYQNSEKNIIAGVYLNRLKKNMRLQADPTVIFAHQDFTIKRLLKKHLEIDSPFNTYKYNGLPPGPINCPSVASIDAVLNAQNHDFIFFCAKEDFSGFHNFSNNYSEHLRQAKAYQQALDKAGM